MAVKLIYTHSALNPSLPNLRAFRKFKANRSRACSRLNIPSNRLASYVKRAVRPFSFGGYNFLFSSDFALFRSRFLGFKFASWGLRKTWTFVSPLFSTSSVLFADFARWTSFFVRGLGGWLLAKLKYKGKSFRWYKKKGALILRFGHSHLVAATPALHNLWWKRKGRMKIIFYGSNYCALKSFLASVIRWRPMNIYHGRGLRLAKQLVIRKAGKVSAYR